MSLLWPLWHWPFILFWLRQQRTPRDMTRSRCKQPGKPHICTKMLFHTYWCWVTDERIANKACHITPKTWLVIRSVLWPTCQKPHALNLPTWWREKSYHSLVVAWKASPAMQNFPVLLCWLLLGPKLKCCGVAGTDKQGDFEHWIFEKTTSVWTRFCRAFALITDVHYIVISQASSSTVSSSTAQHPCSKVSSVKGVKVQLCWYRLPM